MHRSIRLSLPLSSNGISRQRDRRFYAISRNAFAVMNDSFRFPCNVLICVRRVRSGSVPWLFKVRIFIARLVMHVNFEPRYPRLAAEVQRSLYLREKGRNESQVEIAIARTTGNLWFVTGVFSAFVSACSSHSVARHYGRSSSFSLSTDRHVRETAYVL